MGAAQKPNSPIRRAASIGRESKNGKPKLPKGYGTMKGRILFRADIDLTKPIAEQVFKANRASGRRNPRVAPAA